MNHAMMKLWVSFSVFSLFSSANAALQAPSFAGITIETLADFNFGGTPRTQFDRYPLCKNGRQQTPIDISEPFTSDPQAKIALSNNADMIAPRALLFNQGHFPQITPVPETPRIYLTFKGAQYVFTQFHLHYGQSNKEGSVHALNGKKFPLEVHLVFHQPSLGALREAAKHRNGVMIFAVFHRIGQYDETLGSIIPFITSIPNANQSTYFAPSRQAGSILDILPDLNSKFYYYDGSLDSAPCLESVRWVIFDTTHTLTADQMNSLRGVLKTPHNTLQIKSWRYLQNRNDRPIFVRPSISSSSDSINEMVDINFSG